MTAATATAQRRPRTSGEPRAPKAATGRPPTLWLVGATSRTDQIANALEELDIELGRLEALPGRVADDDVGVLFAPRSDDPVARGVKKFRDEIPRSALPLFVVIDDETSDAEVRRLYAAGATAVFHWPREALLMSRLIAELLGLAWVRGPAGRADQALTRAVRAHLRLTRWPTDGIRIDARSTGVVQVIGSVPSLPRRRELLRKVSAVPGVKQVRAERFWVEPSGRPDRSIAATIRSVLKNTTPVDHRTVSVSVRNGTAFLAGTVDDRRELRRVDELVAQVLGVRSIRNMLVVSEGARQIDSSLARRVRALLGARFSEDIEAAVFSAVVVLSGTVDNLSRRREIEEFVEENVPEVKRIVNKIDVG